MAATRVPSSAFESKTFDLSWSIAIDDDVGAASISPAGRDVVLASRKGLRIIDLDSPYSLPLFIANQSGWSIVDVQWSPFAGRAEWIASTHNQNALIYNLNMSYSSKKPPVEYTLRTHNRGITDINFSAHHPDLLATCAVDSFVVVHDLRTTQPTAKLAEFTAGATQVKWNRQNDKIIASAHNKKLHIWDLRRGATPLTTIDAHSTQIYGIDWSRTDEHKILTCSLDSTIKLWSKVGVLSDISAPRRVIQTHYPVWRARHTPFPNGILAMPHRGNSSLWLYKHIDDSSESTFNGPAYDFPGHNNGAHVREFLWRTRGSTDHSIDDRDFQLVSWGTDKHLRLHKVPPELIESTVGFRKGWPLAKNLSLTRQGASYVSYRDTPVYTGTETTEIPLNRGHQRKGNLSALLQDKSRDYEKYPSLLLAQLWSTNDGETYLRPTMTTTPIRRRDPRVVPHITWMDGINISNRFRTGLNPDDSTHQRSYDLGAEISHVGNKYKKLVFENIDVPGRTLKVGFNGPWGEYDSSTDSLKLVFLRFTIRFPTTYPMYTEEMQPTTCRSIKTYSPLHIEFEKTTASISQGTQSRLMENMRYIAQMCAEQEREALEAVLLYALGDRDSDQTPKSDQVLGADSSSESEGHDGEFTDDLMLSSHSNANVPLPIQCTARFSASGCLALATIPASKKSTFALDTVHFRIPKTFHHTTTKDDIFESFGRFTTHAIGNLDDASSPTSSVGSWETSSSPSSSSGSGDAGNVHLGNFRPPLAWQKAASQFQSRNSVPSSSGTGRKAPKARSKVSIIGLEVDGIIPSRRVLAEEYRIFGPGPVICEHNSEVARRHGFEDLGDIWMLCKLILNNEVPLEILPQQHRRDQVLVLARRALVRIKRKDSGLDLQFDEADTVTNPKLRGRIKWGNHAVVTWLIPALFNHFERLADTQMLAMLSCIFAEPAAREGVTSAMAKMRQSQLPMSMEAPAFSLDYFSSADAAWSLFRPSITVPSTPSHLRYATPANEFGWQRLAKNLDTYGSHGSSNGPWGSDTINSEPVTPFTSGNTPPLSRASTVKSAQTATHTPYSTSPEMSHTALKKSSTANFANAVAALSRPFANAISSSPPVKTRLDDLSTSAPASGVTWGATTFYGSGSQERGSLAPSRSKHNKRASFGQAERVNVDYIDDSDSEYEKNDQECSYPYDGISEFMVPGGLQDNDGDDGLRAIKVTLKNQDQFDDEACVSKPLLDMSKDWLHRAWRGQYAEMLSSWGLVSQRAEVLKFNGLVSYFPSEESRGGSNAGSISLALNKGGYEELGGPSTRHLSRASTTLAPPPLKPGQVRRSPAASPRLFSFNPEATEFQPGTAVLTAPDDIAPPPDAILSTERYLRLSIPAPISNKEIIDSVTGLGTSPGGHNRLHPKHGRSSRPSLSRGASNVSGTSAWREGRSLSTIATNTTSKPAKSDPIYSCSICWIRVSGRFYVCPACGHVAHFDCMDDELGMDDGECVVGCGCGCGLEDDDERSRMEAYIEGVRVAQAAGITWDEKDEWPSMASHSLPTTPGVYLEGGNSDFMTGGATKTPVGHGDEKRKELLTRRAAADTSPSPTTRKKEKSKGKRRVRASALSYY